MNGWRAKRLVRRRERRMRRWREEAQREDVDDDLEAGSDKDTHWYTHIHTLSAQLVPPWPGGVARVC